MREVRSWISSIAGPGKNLSDCHLFLEVDIPGGHARHFLPLLQRFLKAGQVQSLSKDIKIGSLG
jgi:hypothetical protein